MRVELLTARKQIAYILEDYLQDRINNDEAFDAILQVDCGDDKELVRVACGLALTLGDPFNTSVHSKSPRGRAEIGRYFNRMIAFLRSELPYPTRRNPLGPVARDLRMLKFLLRCLSFGIYPRDVQEAENGEDFWPFSSIEEMHAHMPGGTRPNEGLPAC
jgi:hypothetical protein